MRQIRVMTLIIMIHSGLSSWANAAVDFNKEIEMVMTDQYETHMAVVKQSGATEAAVDFENKYRKPSVNKSLTFFPLKLRPKPSPRPKTKVARASTAIQNKVDLIEISRQQMM